MSLLPREKLHQTTSDVLPLSHKAAQSGWGSKRARCVQFTDGTLQDFWALLPRFFLKNLSVPLELPTCEATLKRSFLLFPAVSVRMSARVSVRAGHLVTPLTSEYGYLFDQ